MNTPWKQAEDEFSIYVEDARGSIVADVRSQHMDMKEHRRRASLISAAPELLIALKRVMEHHYHPIGPDFPEAWAAIAKAEVRK